MQYSEFLSPELLKQLNQMATPAFGIDGLTEVDGDSIRDRGLETPEAMAFLIELYERVQQSLFDVLEQRKLDRAFVDARTKACVELNRTLNIDFTDPKYQTVIGHEDSRGRIVVGPLQPGYHQQNSKTQVAPLPAFLQGHHVTLFGPPDDAKLSINAMNAVHRKHPSEPPIVEEILKVAEIKPKWGADDEDSKTPLREDLIAAGVNLSGCLDGTLTFVDPKNQKRYELADTNLIQPIKRFPGLALPCTFLFWKQKPIPLHLYDFALHFFRNHTNPEALVFYVPKLENETEAAYIHQLMSTAESMIRKINPKYIPGTIRLMIVLENPRAVFRVHEIIQNLYPFFAGASLGWHDYLASTARLFKLDPNYRIPVKADPNIVIRCIQASHRLLNEVVGPAGGIKVGGMYGILPIDNDLTSASYQATLVGFFKDVITQLKRGLDGFWIAHPDFIRLGLALVEAWKQHQTGKPQSLQTLVQQYLNSTNSKQVQDFISGPDIQGYTPEDPLYPRYLIVAHSKESVFVPNHDLEEVRYNVFQSLQYITDWLSGNGCVALPALVQGVPVRVMDDLATAERSRWEVWHEVHHGRVTREDLVRIAHEELRFIRKNLSDAQKQVQVQWDSRTSKWYPVALELMLQLMSSETPPEFATELLLPFTLNQIRSSADPIQTARSLCPGRYILPHRVQRLHQAFERCASRKFANAIANLPAPTPERVHQAIAEFELSDIIEAAGFHGDIGEPKTNLDAVAASEQKQISQDSNDKKNLLLSLGQQYLKQFGFKFLISAAGKSADETLATLQTRLLNSREQEIDHAKLALTQITLKRMKTAGDFDLNDQLKAIIEADRLPGVQIALCQDAQIQSLSFGVEDTTVFPIASLSKTFGSAFALETLHKFGFHAWSSVNDILKSTTSTFRLETDAVQVRHLMNHQALNLHYVKGVPLTEPVLSAASLLNGDETYGYEPLRVIHPPGTQFQYSGAGFIVLEHLVEALTKKSILDTTPTFLAELNLSSTTFNPKVFPGRQIASGHLDDHSLVPNGRYQFPSFSAGMLSTAPDVLHFLKSLVQARQALSGCGPISHETAIQMLWDRDRSSRDFMGCNIGLGVFIAEAGPNRFAVHQGANDGFRALSFYGVEGPDQGKGFVILVNQDHRAVESIVKIALKLIQHLQISGVDLSSDFRIPNPISNSNLPQEHRVNRTYQDLLFSRFEEDLPEPIIVRGPIDPMSPFNFAVGGHVIDTSNQRFARGENLLSPHEPIFDVTLYGREGKVMDSWESVRHNRKPESEPIDTLVFSPGQTAPIRFVSFSTKFHDGNHSPAVRLEGRSGPTWQMLLQHLPVDGHSWIGIDLGKEIGPFHEFRVSMIPDGGLSRIGLFGSNLPQSEQMKFKPLDLARCIRYPEPIPHPQKPLSPSYVASPLDIQNNFAALKPGQLFDVASAAYGGRVIRASNEHYGPAKQVISPYPPINMFDGFESARSRVPGHYEEVELELGRPALLDSLQFDFSYFRNNNPLEVLVEGRSQDAWLPLLGQRRVKEFAGNRFEGKIRNPKVFDRIRVRVIPDGGIHRIRIFTRN
jgi:malate synthase